jgi:GNAT superfamily N-acetyltransferase
MAEPVRVRVATQYDEAAALDVIRAEGEASGRQLGKSRLATARGELRSPQALTLVAGAGAEVDGVLVARLGASPALELVLVCVRPGLRRSGTGRALVTALLDRFPSVSATVDDPDVAALLQACAFMPGDGRWVHP